MPGRYRVGDARHAVPDVSRLKATGWEPQWGLEAMAKAYWEWSAKGAEFLTEPKDHGRELRAYIRDPDGHLIEVGQTTGLSR